MLEFGVGLRNSRKRAHRKQAHVCENYGSVSDHAFPHRVPRRFSSAAKGDPLSNGGSFLWSQRLKTRKALLERALGSNAAPCKNCLPPRRTQTGGIQGATRQFNLWLLKLGHPQRPPPSY